MGYDPLIHFIDNALAPVDHLLLPFCDDLGCACTNIHTAWGIIIRCFIIIEKISSLHLNNEKTQFLFTSPDTSAQDRLTICDIDAMISPNQFHRVIKYLGILLGENAIELNWKNVCPEFIEVAKFIGSLDCGMMTKISLYNILAISKLSFVGQFHPPNKIALRAEHRAIQLLSRGPWNAIPPRLLKSLKSIVLPTQIRDLSTTSQASKIRVAASTSSNIFSLYSHMLELQYFPYDFGLAFLDNALLQSLSIHCIVDTYSLYISNPICTTPPEETNQSQICKTLSSHLPKFDFSVFLRIRLSRYFPEGSFEIYINPVLEYYRNASARYGFALPLTHLRAIANHWCTASRFGNKFHACQFGCGHDTDQLAHTISCSKFWSLFFAITGVPHNDITLKDILLFHGPTCCLGEEYVFYIMLGCHICFLCLNHCRYHGNLSKRIIVHHLHTFINSHYKIRALLRSVRALSRSRIIA